MTKRKNNQARYRCTTVGCNPTLEGASEARLHFFETGHNFAKWPIRSKEGKRKARQRNKSGYYDKYNVGDKSYENRSHHIKF